MRTLALAALLALAACGINPKARTTPAPTQTSPPSSSPAPSPAPPPAATQVYTLAIAGSSSLSGPIGQRLLDPLLVEARDAQGQLADHVYVIFEAVDATKGPLGLGTDTTGAGTWLVTGPGTGQAAADAIPWRAGPALVRAQVIPVVSSAPTPPATSNVVFFTITGL